MRKLPLIFSSSTYKYTILARLTLLQGAESQLKQRKRELLNYLVRHGVARTTAERWLKTQKEERPEIPGKVLMLIRDWFNRKYASGQQIYLEDLFHPELRGGVNA